MRLSIKDDIDHTICGLELLEIGCKVHTLNMTHLSTNLGKSTHKRIKGNPTLAYNKKESCTNKRRIRYMTCQSLYPQESHKGTGSQLAYINSLNASINSHLIIQKSAFFHKKNFHITNVQYKNRRTGKEKCKKMLYNQDVVKTCL